MSYLCELQFSQLQNEAIAELTPKYFHIEFQEIVVVVGGDATNTKTRATAMSYTSVA